MNRTFDCFICITALIPVYILNFMCRTEGKFDYGIAFVTLLVFAYITCNIHIRDYEKRRQTNNGSVQANSEKEVSLSSKILLCVYIIALIPVCILNYMCLAEDKLNHMVPIVTLFILSWLGCKRILYIPNSGKKVSWSFGIFTIFPAFFHAILSAAFILLTFATEGNLSPKFAFVPFLIATQIAYCILIRCLEIRKEVKNNGSVQAISEKELSLSSIIFLGFIYIVLFVVSFVVGLLIQVPLFAILFPLQSMGGSIILYPPGI